jgi:hypothetical protein
LAGVRGIPNKSLVVRLKIEYPMLQVWPEFLQTKKDSETFEIVSGKIPLQLGLGGIRYGQGGRHRILVTTLQQRARLEEEICQKIHFKSSKGLS